MEITAESVDGFCTGKRNGRWQNSDFIVSIRNYQERRHEDWVEIKGTFGERLRRGRKNGVRDVILPSPTQSLKQVVDFSAEENAIEWKDWRRWEKTQSEQQELKKVTKSQGGLSWGGQRRWLQYCIYSFPVIRGHVCVCNIISLRAFSNHRPWVAFVWLPHKINNKNKFLLDFLKSQECLLWKVKSLLGKDRIGVGFRFFCSVVTL